MGWNGVVALMGLVGISCIFLFCRFSVFHALKSLVVLSGCLKNALVIDSTKFLKS